MKTALLVIYFCLISVALNAQNLSNKEKLEFYPYNEENIWLYNWVYIDPILEYAEAGFDKIESTNDTLINNKSYWIMKYYYKNFNSCEIYYEGIDSVTGDVMRLDENSLFEPRRIDNVFACVGDTISIYDNPNLTYCNKLVITSISDTIINNYSTTIREVIGIPSQQRLLFAKGIGLLGSGKNYWLDSAIVDGNVFKNISSDISTIDESLPIITNFTLYQNYPNPFNPTTTINYTLQSRSKVTIKLYDVTGRKIKTLINSEKPSGKYSYNFNGVDLVSGIYFYRMNVNGFSKTMKMVMLK